MIEQHVQNQGAQLWIDAYGWKQTYRKIKIYDNAGEF